MTQDQLGVHTFNTHVRKEEDGAEPCHFGLESLSCPSTTLIVLTDVLSSVYLAGLLPESDSEAYKLDDGDANLQASVSLPKKPW